MAINFKNLPNSSGEPDDKTFDHLQQTVSKIFQTKEACEIRVGMSKTQITHEGITISLPFGVPQIKNVDSGSGHPILHKTYNQLIGMLKNPKGLIYHAPKITENVTGALNTSNPTAYDDMTDEQWVEHTAGELFPGTVHLYQTEQMYQPVLGTSGGSIYKTCVIGPELKIACRIKNTTVSFRVTTNKDEMPSGTILTVFKRLGDFSEYSNRLTVHASMGGSYDLAHAHEYRALFGAYYAALKPWITSDFPAIGKLTEGVK